MNRSRRGGHREEKRRSLQLNKIPLSALKVSLFFLVAFLLLGKPLLWSFSLAVLAGIATGLIVTGWHSKELPTEQKFSPELTKVLEDKVEKETKKRQPKRSRRQPQKSWFFWKNPRRPPKKRR
ncbi:hypothetical protein IQ264_09680 [Phormidium sp. LEGE 05292]|uniref:hypothetical protein n=1 Tax=[Phormidium] sp. LEGE 05292 TaxID=767427 RepID=UPI00187FAB75|nr:hypothetical protein [Phormidium sp. LEGE 05292]MBE9225691.1 hypothetical protein [Phormidium sp. LEGE 05292]